MWKIQIWGSILAVLEKSSGPSMAGSLGAPGRVFGRLSDMHVENTDLGLKWDGLGSIHWFLLAIELA